jgi:hypothetical protein
MALNYSIIPAVGGGWLGAKRSKRVLCPIWKCDDINIIQPLQAQIMEPSDTTTFYASELEKVGEEQIYAVQSVGPVTSIPSSDSPSAEIEITLLEGKSIVVNLSLAGYRVSILGCLRWFPG